MILVEFPIDPLVGLGGTAGLASPWVVRYDYLDWSPTSHYFILRRHVISLAYSTEKHVGNRRFMAALDAGCASAGCANAACARSCRPHW